MLAWTACRLNDERSLAIVAGDNGIQQIRFNGKPPENGTRDETHPFLQSAVRQLQAYLAGELQEFDLPLDPTGTPFQMQVWKALRAIPYGETRSYVGIANAIGAPKAVRAVGGANGRNPIPIVVPCHRVIGANGALTGFGGGIEIKKFLLALEAQHAQRTRKATA